MKVRTANTAVGDFHLDIGLLERLGLKVAPFHVALGSGRIVSDPTLESLSRCGRHDAVTCRSVNDSGLVLICVNGKEVVA